MPLTAAEILRDYATDGVPASGAWNPRKSELREYLTALEQAGTAHVYAVLFGAAGDGVTDDTLAIQDAIDSLSPGGGTVYLMSGGAVHLTTDVIELPANVNLIGGGAGSLYSELVSPPMTTIKRAAGSGDHILDCDPSGLRYGGTMKGIVFDGNYSAGAQNGILLHAAQGATLIDVVVTQINGGNGIWINRGAYPSSASEIQMHRVHVLNTAAATTGLLVHDMSGCAFYNCHFDGGFVDGVGVRITDLADTNAFYTCSMGCFGAGGIAYKLDGAGFNNNVFGGSIQTIDGLGTEVYAGGNTHYSHFWGVYLAYGATIYNDVGAGRIHFHDCYYPSGFDRYPLITAITITSTVDWVNPYPFTIELMFWGTISGVQRIRNGSSNAIGATAGQTYCLLLDPGDGVNITHAGLTASAMPH